MLVLKKLVIGATLGLISTWAFANNSHCDQFVPFGYPTINKAADSTMLCRIAFVTKHDNTKKTPIYSAEWLLVENLDGKNKRKDAFKADPDLQPGKRAELSDYDEEYDRGHMVPFEDARKDSAAALQTFYLSNIVPQNLHLNRGMWRALENRVREWARNSTGGVYVFTGPIYDNNVIYWKSGNNRVAIPNRLFKVIINKQLQQGIAFIVPNTDPVKGTKFGSYAVPISDVERVTGLDFTPNSTYTFKNVIGSWF